MNTEVRKFLALIALLFSLCYLDELNKQDSLRKREALAKIQTQEELLNKVLVPVYQEVEACQAPISHNYTWGM